MIVRLGRLTALTGVAAVASFLFVLLGAQPAAAHPMGSFSVNQYAGLTLYPDHVGVDAAVSTAELPTAQDRAGIDADRDGRLDDGERARHAAGACADFAARFEVTVDGRALQWTVTPGPYTDDNPPGTPTTARLTCTLDAPADLSAARVLTVVNRYRDDRVGWHELSATGSGVRLLDPPVPARSISDALRAYPVALDNPAALLDVRSARIATEPGDAAPQSGPAGNGGPAGSGPAVPGGLGARADRRLWELTAGRLTPPLVAAAVLLALLLGAGHAALPGHGKTVVAVYLAGRRGRVRDAVAVGATVTASHTGAVLVVGLLISGGTALAGERLLGWLGIASGLIIATVGAAMFLRRAPAVHHHHSHDHPHAHDHDHPRDHDHGRRAGRGWGLAGLGLAGGLVPSPSALVVLLAAIGIGRAAFGVLLIVLYGVGMAATLTAAGLALLAARRRFADRLDRISARLAPVLPKASAALVVAVGLAMATHAAVVL